MKSYSEGSWNAFGKEKEKNRKLRRRGNGKCFPHKKLLPAVQLVPNGVLSCTSSQLKLYVKIMKLKEEIRYLMCQLQAIV